MQQTGSRPKPSDLAPFSVKSMATAVGAFILGVAASLTGIGLILGIPFMLFALYLFWQSIAGRSGSCPYCETHCTFSKDEVFVGCPKCHKALKIEGMELVPIGDCPNCGKPPAGVVFNDVMKCRSCKHRLVLKNRILTDVS